MRRSGSNQDLIGKEIEGAKRSSLLPGVARSASASPSASGSYWAAVRAIVWKETLLERRSWETLVATVTFALLVVVLFHFAFDVRGGEEARFFPGAVWVALLFAGTVGMTRTAQLDAVEGRGRALLLAPVDRSALFVGKLLANLLLLAVTQAVAVPLMIASFGLQGVASPGVFVAGLALGTWGFASLGTLLSSASGGDRGLGLILPLLLFPLLVPVALGGAEVLSTGLTGDTGPTAWAWMRLMLVFDVLFTALPALFYEYIAEV